MQAEIEGRRQVRVMLDIVRQNAKWGNQAFLRGLMVPTANPPTVALPRRTVRRL